MATKHLNVQYLSNEPINIKVSANDRLTDVITAIANFYSDSISSPERIQLFDTENTLISTWKQLKELRAEYFEEESGVSLTVDLLPLPSPSQSISRFEIRYPNGMNLELVEIVQKLSQLLKLPEFTSTFELEASHQEILDVLKEKKLVIRFTNASDNNSSLVCRPKDCYVNDEYGWFDGRVSLNCVNINYGFYSETNHNVPFLKVLAIVTVIHELQHFLRAHLTEKSPTQPIPSSRPPETESDDSWEVKNLGGRLGILWKPKIKFFVYTLQES